MKLSIPFYKQKTNYTCGPASLHMVLAFFGDFKSESKLARLSRTDKEGTRHNLMIESVCEEGFFCYVNGESSLHEIKHFIDSDIPVIVNFIEPSGDGGHYSVVSGYRKGKIILNDPWNGKDFTLSDADFLKRWHDDRNGHKYNKWMMAVSKEDFHMGKQYRPINYE